MSARDDQPIEAVAEAIVFAHEGEEAPLPRDAAAEVAALERAAALAAAALTPKAAEPLPAHLRERLAAAGLSFCAHQRHREAAATAGPRPGFTTTLPRRQLRPLLCGAAIGAAAAATVLWFTQLRPQHAQVATMREQVLASHAANTELRDRLQQSEQRVQQVERTVAELRPQEADLRKLREQVLAHDTTAVHQHWQPGPSPHHGDVTGDVVWSQERQDGWLTFRGLPKLDPDHAYQLWIVDQQREGAPVDGGLFVIGDPGTETFVPIHARLRINRPVAFVITIEPKDGVVVSKREHVVAIAGL